MTRLGAGPVYEARRNTVASRFRTRRTSRGRGRPQPLLNGHRVTEEMCATLQADHPEQADHFVFEDLVAMTLGDGPAGPQRPRRRPHSPEGAAQGSSPTTRTAACRTRSD
ncbi:hypothetical protein GCM10010300_76980 [Streptomyces olivaceoviridis]|nr:hypothetical protein GCM10010300_76980 [Streptomyces olivaceoviridis]